MDTYMEKIIKEILERGNTAEIKQRKDDVVVLEVTRKIVYTKSKYSGICKRQNGAGSLLRRRLPAFLC